MGFALANWNEFCHPRRWRATWGQFGRFLFFMKQATCALIFIKSFWSSCAQLSPCLKEKCGCQASPYDLLGGGVYAGMRVKAHEPQPLGQPSTKKMFLFSDFKETFALSFAFLNAVCPQNPYWVHLNFKVQNSIYMFTSS